MWLNSGQRITCELGHPVATAKERCHPGDGAKWMSQMTWHIPPPEEGAPSVCQCGRVWHFTYNDGETYCWWLCVDEIWFPKLTSAARRWLDEQR